MKLPDRITVRKHTLKVVIAVSTLMVFQGIMMFWVLDRVGGRLGDLLEALTQVSLVFTFGLWGLLLLIGGCIVLLPLTLLLVGTLAVKSDTPVGVTVGAVLRVSGIAYVIWMVRRVRKQGFWGVFD